MIFVLPNSYTCNAIYFTNLNFRKDSLTILSQTHVLTKYNSKMYKVDDIDFASTPESTFNFRGQTMSFIDYYKVKYGLEIKDAKQPMMLSKVKFPGKEESQTVMLVPELCNLTGMSDAMRQDFRVMKDVAQYTRLPPPQRQQIVLGFLASIRENQQAMELLNSWGLSLPEKTMALEGRVLKPATLLFGGDYKEVVGPKGDWGRTTTSKPVLKAVALQNWALIYPSREEQYAKKLCDGLMQNGRRMGLSIAKPKLIAVDNDKTESYLQKIPHLGHEFQMVRPFE